MKRLVATVVTVCVLSVVTVGTTGTARAAELVYFMSEACGVCDRWNDEIGSIYHKTEESNVLPLRTYSVHEDRPEDLAFIKGIAYTPTFVVVEDGREVGRIVGYIADYFFWDGVKGLIEKAEAAPTRQNASCPEGETGETPVRAC